MSFSSLVYKSLSAGIYPMFRKKVIAVEGLEHVPARGGFIIAANHVDWLDGFYLASVVDHERNVPVHSLTTSGNYWWTTVAMQIPRDRSQVVDVVVRQLKTGKVLCNFPEGHRNNGLTLGPGKTGTVRMAAYSGVPVIPLGITCEPGRNMGQSLRFLLSRQHSVHLRFGPPLTFAIPSGGVTKEWLISETERLMKAIAPLANKSYTPGSLVEVIT